MSVSVPDVYKATVLWILRLWFFSWSDSKFGTCASNLLRLQMFVLFYKIFKKFREYFAEQFFVCTLFWQ